MDRPHWHFDRKGSEESKPKQHLYPTCNLPSKEADTCRREFMCQQCGDIGGARINIHRHHRHQHQHRTKEGVEEEFERRIDAVFAAPNPNN